MHPRITLARLSSLLAATLLAAACSDAVSPERSASGATDFSHMGVPDTIRITGVGSLGSGTPTPGSSLQDFDLDVASSLNGRVSYRDWSVVRADGSAGTLTVAPSDTATRISAFRDSSTVCTDPSRGVEFEGIGRVNTGGDSDPARDELLAFTGVACDEGPAGSGADVFALSVPAHGYAAGPDRVTSGDLTKSVSGSPAQAVQLVFTVQPSNAFPYPLGTIQPPVRVTAVDDQGNAATGYAGQVTIAISRNAGVLLPGTLRGPTTVTALNGVASFPNLSIDQPGIGYTLVVTSAGLAGAESASFTILAPLGLP